MAFNDEQQKAIDSRVGENVLISAGAGSGKTKTLSSKVYNVCAKDGIRPSDLLVLTFTNKAAFEMKERIIAQFRENDSSADNPMTDEILSSHIQTFDSFSLYLVQQYSRVLKIPSTISIMDENILSAKANEFLDAIFQKHYDEHDKRFLNMIAKFNMGDDSATRRVVLDLEKKLKNLLPSQKENFVGKYDHFLEKKFLEDQEKAFLEEMKGKLSVGLRKVALFWEKGNQNIEDLDTLFEELRHIDYDHYDISGFSFGEENLDRILNLANGCLVAEVKDLLEMARTETGEQAIWNLRSIKPKLKEGQSKELWKRTFEILRDAVRDEFLLPLQKIGSFDKQFAILQSFREDAHVLFDLVNELDERLEEYKFLANAYSFQDISNMALSLLIDEKYKEAGESIKNRFKYILVDEYQDTNDFQETFLNAISEKATLFTVGDAKQAIYGFRNSNCQLFLDRKARYEREDNSNCTVINMNKNYRSVEKILEDVNAIFVNYMSKEHGGIVYTDMEMLSYDKKADVYRLARENNDGEYGIRLLDYSDVPEDIRGDKVSCECLAIIRDIQRKVQDGYKVLDFIGGKLSLRSCTYKDFAILIRKRSHFDIYQKLFLDNGIPLNNEIETGFHDIDAILTLQSLVRLIAFFLGQTKENVWHLYFSVARSYLFGKREGYDDDRIYRTIQDKELWEKDTILLKVKEFIAKEKNKAFSRIFLDLMDEFGVVRNLPYLGDVSNNTSKIESYYQLLVNQENAGEGLKDFVDLFKDIDKYQIAVSASSVTSLEDAVSLMTIHQSKGLEFKIVYMPLCDNGMASGSNRSKPDYVFSRDYGLLLPNYAFNEPIDTFLKTLYLENEGSKNGEISEHVRLFYVALTRPKETLYIVGKKSDVRKGKENLLDMLDYTFHYEGIQPVLFERYRASFDLADVAEYDDLVRQFREFSERRQELIQLSQTDEGRSIAAFLFENLIQVPLEKNMSDCRNRLAMTIYDDLVEKARKNSKAAIRFLVFYYTGFDFKEDLNGFLAQNVGKLVHARLATDEEGLRRQAGSLLEALETGSENKFVKDHLFVRDPKLKKKDDKKKSDEENLALRRQEAVKAFLDPLLFTAGEWSQGLTDVFYPLFASRTVSLKPEGKGRLEDYRCPDLPVDDKPIAIPVQEKRRASKLLSDEEAPSRELLDKGVLFHRYLEVLDFQRKDIPAEIFESEADRNVIRKVLEFPLFDNLGEARVYKEYSYYDPEFKTNGSIDLLIVRKDGDIDIVDYKLKNIDDDAYRTQLATYRRNVERLFGKDRQIRTYLLSLLECRLEEIRS